MPHIPQHKKIALDRILTEVEKKFNRGSAGSWVNRDFQDLGFEIMKATDTRLSADTLKRIFGKLKTADGYYPQEATLNALISYSGYAEHATHPPQPNPLKRPQVIFSIGLGLVAFIIWLIVPFFKTQQLPSFRFEYAQKQGCAPLTAAFHYEVSQLMDDSVWIDFGDHTRLELPRDKNLVNHYYQYPDLFIPKLYYGQKEIGQAKVYVGSKGWVILGSHWLDESRYYPVDPKVANKGGYLFASADDLANSGMDTIGMIMTQYSNFKAYNIDGAHFKMTCEVRNTIYKPPVRCNGVHIEIQGTDGTIYQSFNKPGCERWNTIQYGEIILNGAHHDLSAFAQDLSDWSEITISVQQNEAEIALNGTLLYQLPFYRPIGTIIGLRFQFFGYGAIKNVELKDLNTCQSYQSEFTLSK